jgi:hypothetical protein
MEFNEKEIIKLLLMEVFPEADNPVEAAEKTRKLSHFDKLSVTILVSP